VFVTTMSRALAAAMSIWSKPTLNVAMIFVLGGRALMQTEWNRSPAAPKRPAALASVARRAISAPSVAQGASLRVQAGIVILGGARLDRLGQLAGDEQDGLGHEASSRGLWAQEAPRPC
jgi:hypothetical protein